MSDLASQASDRSNHMDEYDQYDKVLIARDLLDKKARLDLCARTIARGAVAVDLLQKKDVK